MRRSRRNVAVTLLAVSLLLPAGPAWADDDPPQDLGQSEIVVTAQRREADGYNR